MSISAQEVVKLRQISGAGMMDCKQALLESQGSIDKAVEILRKKGQKLAQARADRATSEGRILLRISEDKTEGTLIGLSCETDFVAKNDAFNQLAEQIADTAQQQRPSTIEELLKLKCGQLLISEQLDELVVKIGEKVTLTHYHRLSGSYVVDYLHVGGKLGVLLAMSSAESRVAEDVGKNVAMQIAAMKPITVDKHQIPSEAVEKELEIAKELARKEGKPEQLLDKIANGRLQKFFKEQTLLQQAYVKDSNLSVAQYIASVSKDLKIDAFLRISIAE